MVIHTVPLITGKFSMSQKPGAHQGSPSIHAERYETLKYILGKLQLKSRVFKVSSFLLFLPPVYDFFQHRQSRGENTRNETEPPLKLSNSYCRASAISCSACIQNSVNATCCLRVESATKPACHNVFDMSIRYNTQD